MRGYRFLISASCPCPLKTIRIRILFVQMLLQTDTLTDSNRFHSLSHAIML